LSVSGLCKLKQSSTNQLGGDDSLNDNRRFFGKKKRKNDWNKRVTS